VFVFLWIFQTVWLGFSFFLFLLSKEQMFSEMEVPLCVPVVYVVVAAVVVPTVAKATTKKNLANRSG